jgi:tetratricopeptide (TPR) repeat protein
VLSEISRYHMLAGRTTEALAAGGEALELARELDLPAIEAHALNNIGVARFNSGDLDGVRDVEKSLQIAVAADSPEAARSYNNLAVAYWVLGETVRGTEARADAVLTDRRYGRTRLGRFAEGALLQNDFAFGKWDEFLAGSRRFAEESGQLGRAYPEAFHLLGSAMIALARGQDEDAVSMARAGADRARLAADPQIIMPSLATLAVIDHELGDAAAARRWIDELSKTVGQTSLVFELIPLTVVALDLGVAEQLRQLVTPFSGPTKWLTVMDLALAREFRSAARLLDEMGMAPFAARLRLSAAEQLVADGRLAKADEELRRALEFWRSVGAKRYIGRAEVLLSKAS